MTIGTCVAGLVTRQVVHSQQQRLLDQRANELTAALSSAVSGIPASLRAVGVAAEAHDDTPELRDIAGPMLSPGTTITVFQESGTGFHRLAELGDSTRPLSTGLTSRRQQLARRAVTAPDFVSGVSGTIFLIALRVPAPVPTVVLYAVPIRKTQTTPTASNDPYSDLNVAVYASARPDPNALLVVSGNLPRPSADSLKRTVAVGSDKWLVVIAPRGSLVGAFTAMLPWIITAIGALLTIVGAMFVLVLTRRRAYAYRLVRERTRALQHAQEAAEVANLAKSEFLSRMSHELRTPLNAVLGFSQLLEMDDLTNDQMESVHQISKGGRHLLNLINEILDISHIEAGKLSLSLEPVLVSEVIQETTDLMKPLAQERALDLRGTDNGLADSYIFTDRQRLKQILLNLVSNAVKYNRQGGSVSITCAEITTGRLRISVTDTGAGIDPAQLPLLFRPFERLGAERTTIEGTGIGLALSHKLTEALGGTLSVDSTLGHGSTFWVEFPRVEGPVDRYERLHPSAPQAERVDPQESRPKVLYIEDNLANLKLVERILTQRPHIELIPTMQGRLGLELAKEHHPDVVLLDLNLADVPGEQVLQQLRGNPDTANIPIVIVSADAMPRNVQKLLTAGAAEYLTKPLNVGELLNVLDSHLGVADRARNKVPQPYSASTNAPSPPVDTHA